MPASRLPPAASGGPSAPGRVAAHPRPAPFRRRARLAHRAGAAGMVAVLLSLGGVGCASFDATFGQQEAVVQFRPGTSSAVRLKVRAACSHVPSVKPEPLPTHPAAAASSYDIRYQVGGASDGDLARLQQCLQRFPSVAGIEFSGPAGS